MQSIDLGFAPDVARHSYVFLENFFYQGRRAAVKSKRLFP
jgi:hypothetical protein